MRNYISVQESFYLQSILSNVNEQHISFLECKHKHMMKSGAPPDKFRALYHRFTYRIHGFTSRINSKGYHAFVPGLISICLEMIWVPSKP